MLVETFVHIRMALGGCNRVSQRGCLWGAWHISSGAHGGPSSPSPERSAGGPHQHRPQARPTQAPAGSTEDTPRVMDSTAATWPLAVLPKAPWSGTPAAQCAETECSGGQSREWSPSPRGCPCITVRPSAQAVLPAAHAAVWLSHSVHLLPRGWGVSR